MSDNRGHNHANDGYGREHRDKNAKAHGDRKSANRPRAKHKKKGRGDQSGDIRIHDGRIGAPKACIEGRQGAEPFSAFFSNAFVDENIRIDGEANPKHNTGDARQCQCRDKKA